MGSYWLSPAARWLSGTAANHVPPRGLAAGGTGHTYRKTKVRCLKRQGSDGRCETKCVVWILWCHRTSALDCVLAVCAINHV